MATDRSGGSERFDRRIGLRLRIAVVAAVAVGVALTIGAVVLVGLLRSRLDNAATTAALLRATDVAALATAEALPRALALPGEESAFVQVIDRTGEVVASSENIDGEPAITTRRPVGSQPLAFTMSVEPLDKSQPMRVVAIDAATDVGVVTVYAGESLERAEETVSAIAVALLAGVPLLVLIVTGVTWWSVGRTLRPVRTITRTMAEITAHDLHRRVPTPCTRDEIGQLATTVNETLARLDFSVEQQRRFVADASHELRGPLASLRADLEISVTHPEHTDWRDVARDTLGDVERLQYLTEDLLALARLDADPKRTQQPVDLADIVAESLEGLRRADIKVRKAGLDAPSIVVGNEEALLRMVRNLVRNAEEHAETSVDVVIQRAEGLIRLIVADDGPGIPPEDRQRVLERFVRLDSARTRDTGGTGLGLAIVHEVVTSHHGTITISETVPHGAMITVDLPA